eukprot:182558-Chlamydomonas_euryale.AAC.1
MATSPSQGAAAMSPKPGVDASEIACDPLVDVTNRHPDAAAGDGCEGGEGQQPGVPDRPHPVAAAVAPRWPPDVSQDAAAAAGTTGDPNAA